MTAEHSPAVRRVFAEHLPWEELTRAPVLGALAERGLQLVAAVRPPHLAELPRLCRACAAEGVDLALWPMLEDRDGRWVSRANAPLFARFVQDLLAALAPAIPRELVLDLEPPIDHVRAMLDARRLPLEPSGAPRASEVLRALVERLRQGGTTVWGTVVPLVAADPPRRAGWQRMLGTPVDPLGLDRVSAMLYTSLAVGYSRGLLRRRDALSLLDSGARALVRRFGPRAAACLGAVGPGALGDERCYDSPHELAEDVAIVRAAGIEDIALFDLTGILARPPAHAWLDALLAPARPITVPKTRRSRALAGAALVIARVAGWLPGDEP